MYVSNWGGKVPGPTDFTDGMFPVVVDRRTGIPVSGTVSVLDTASNTVVKTIDVGLHPTGMALSPRGDRLYVTNANSDTVSVIDTATDTVVKTLHVGDTGRGTDADARQLAERRDRRARTDERSTSPTPRENADRRRRRRRQRPRR